MDITFHPLFLFPEFFGKIKAQSLHFCFGLYRLINAGLTLYLLKRLCLNMSFDT